MGGGGGGRVDGTKSDIAEYRRLGRLRYENGGDIGSEVGPGDNAPDLDVQIHVFCDSSPLPS